MIGGFIAGKIEVEHDGGNAARKWRSRAGKSQLFAGKSRSNIRIVIHNELSNLVRKLT